MPRSKNMIQIPAADSGDNFSAYVIRPEKTPAPCVILIQEIFGVNQEMRDKCNTLAAQGYLAVAPDLFWRIEPGIELVDSIEDQLERAFELFRLFDVEKGLQDLKTTLAFMRNEEDCNGRVGCVGYCLGGKLAYMMAARSDVDASVSYYGVGIEDMLDEAANIRNPLLLHIAGEDEFVPKDAQKKIMETLKSHQKVDVVDYPGASHAFARGGGMHYDEQAAMRANKITEDFLKTHLAL